MIVISGDETTVGQSMYGWDERNSGYFRDNLRKITDVVKDKTSSVFKNIMNVYNTHNDTDLIDRAKRLLRKAGGGVQDEEAIVRYNDPRFANRRMRAFVMASKRVRNLHNRGIIDGYSDIDVIKDPVILDTLHDMAVDGVYQEDGTCFTYHCLDGVDMEVDALTFDEQIEIKHTWNNVARMLNDDIDPTNRV